MITNTRIYVYMYACMCVQMICRYFLDDFNDDDGLITLLAGIGRHWRTSRSTTCTYLLRYETLQYLQSMDMIIPVWDDYNISNTLTSSAYNVSLVSPLPSLATHIEGTIVYAEHTFNVSYVIALREECLLFNIL